MTPRYDLSGTIGDGEATGAAIGAWLDANPGPVDVIVNSPGGIATEGAAIYAALERHGRATVYVQGIAASAASLAMLGGKRVVIHEAAVVMIHEPAAMTFGTASDLRSDADTLDKLTGVYAAIYSKASGNPLARVAGWMAEETWLTAQEAVALNFADAVDGGASAALVAAFDYRKFRSAPAPLVAAALANGWATVSPDQAKGNGQ